MEAGRIRAVARTRETVVDAGTSSDDFSVRGAGTLRPRVDRANSLRIFLRRFAVALVVVVVITAGTVTAANVIGNNELSKIARIHLPNDVLAYSKPGDPANFLIIGSDSRAFADTPAEEKSFGSAKQIGNARSDVMMVVHVVPALGTAFIVSFPRDTEVDIPGYGHNKLNAAFAFGGPALTIKTFRSAFGIPIQHYLAVDFPGFEKIVDAIGHVKIYFPTPALDTYTGLYEPTAGCKSLDGVGALAYARSRHYAIPKQGVTNPDPKLPKQDWNEDPRADLDRIQRQQYFLRTLGQTALNHGASNLNTAYHLLGAVVSSLQADQNLTNSQLKSLVRTLRGLDPATVEMTTLPVTTDSTNTQLIVQYPEAQHVLNRLKNLSLPVSLPEPVAPAKVRVVVVDGSGVSGRAASVEARLVARGFRNGGVGDASSSNYSKTQIRYAPGEASKGFTVALYLGTANVVEASNTTLVLGSKKLSGDVIVVVGRDFPTLRGLITKPVPTTTAPAVTTTTTPSATGGSQSTRSSTTTSTTPVTTPDTRYVPVARKGLAPLIGCP
jgi:LCP family protein required for cell wall assembly